MNWDLHSAIYLQCLNFHFTKWFESYYGMYEYVCVYILCVCVCVCVCVRVCVYSVCVFTFIN